MPQVLTHPWMVLPDAGAPAAELSTAVQHLRDCSNAHHRLHSCDSSFVQRLSQSRSSSPILVSGHVYRSSRQISRASSACDSRPTSPVDGKPSAAGNMLKSVSASPHRSPSCSSRLSDHSCASNEVSYKKGATSRRGSASSQPSRKASEPQLPMWSQFMHVDPDDIKTFDETKALGRLSINDCPPEQEIC